MRLRRSSRIRAGPAFHPVRPDVPEQRLRASRPPPALSRATGSRHPTAPGARPWTRAATQARWSSSRPTLPSGAFMVSMATFLTEEAFFLQLWVFIHQTSGERRPHDAALPLVPFGAPGR